MKFRQNLGLNFNKEKSKDWKSREILNFQISSWLLNFEKKKKSKHDLAVEFDILRKVLVFILNHGLEKSRNMKF